jgi:hypothetical protein
VSIAEKTRETIERGKENRGDFTPKSGSLPVKMYNYWLTNSPSKKAALIASGSRRENFCHYWRVVAIWAPLRALFNLFERVVTNPITWIALGLVAVALVVYGATTIEGFFTGILWGVGYVAGIAVALGLIMGLLYLASEIIPKKFPRFSAKVDSVFRSRKTWGAVALAILAFVVWLTSHGTGGTGYIVWACIAAVLALVGFLVVKLIDYDNGKKAQRQAEWDALDYETRSQILDWQIAVMREQRKPSKFELKIRGFFRGIGEAVMFFVQVVRVNKWKICPLVEIPQEEKVA